MQVFITDQISDNSAACEPEDIATTITSWFAEAPGDVTYAIGELQKAAMRGRWEEAGEIAEFLAVTIHR